jgi:hypothetical protein
MESVTVHTAMIMASKHKEQETDPPKKRRRISSVARELYATLRHHDLGETLAAIGFKDAAGDSFEKLTKDWYARFRPGRILSTKDDGDKFDHMIVDFMIK